MFGGTLEVCGVIPGNPGLSVRAIAKLQLQEVMKKIWSKILGWLLNSDDTISKNSVFMFVCLIFGFLKESPKKRFAFGIGGIGGTPRQGYPMVPWKYSGGVLGYP